MQLKRAHTVSEKKRKCTKKVWPSKIVIVLHSFWPHFITSITNQKNILFCDLLRKDPCHIPEGLDSSRELRYCYWTYHKSLSDYWYQPSLGEKSFRGHLFVFLKKKPEEMGAQKVFMGCNIRKEGSFVQSYYSCVGWYPEKSGKLQKEIQRG